MIYDKLNNIERYNVLKQIAKFDFSKYQKGKFEINGKDFFGIGLEYNTKNESECLWEAHKRYLDIHVLLEGEEIIHVTDIKNMTVSKEHDNEQDYALFTGTKEQAFELKKGDFLVLYPNEVHKTAVKLNNESTIKKIVFKIQL